MNTVTVKLLIEPVNDASNSNPFFSDGWDFSIDRYTLKKVNEFEVEISFSFEAKLSEIDEDGTNIGILPSEELEEFQEYDEQVEQLLDLLSLTTKIAFRIKARSYELFANGIGGSNRIENKIPVVLKDASGLEKRFQALQEETKENIKLKNSIRAYRQHLLYDDTGDKIAKVWAIIEQLHGNEQGKFFSKEQLIKIKGYFQSWKELSKEQVGKIVKRLEDTQQKSLMDSLVEGIDLMSYEGILSAEEKKKMLKAWRSKRSQPSHGTPIPKRDEEANDILWEMSSTVEGLLYTATQPKMLFYIVFHKSNVNKNYYERQGEVLSKFEGDYMAIPQEEISEEYFSKYLSNELIDDSSCLYIVTHNRVRIITKTEVEEFDASTSDKHLRVALDIVLKKLNE